MIDGFPLDEAQAKAFVTDIGEPTCVMLFEASDLVLENRLKGRNNFDDTPDAIAKRIANYNEKTKPVAQQFKAKVINAEQPADTIFAEVQKIMEAL